MGHEVAALYVCIHAAMMLSRVNAVMMECCSGSAHMHDNSFIGAGLASMLRKNGEPNTSTKTQTRSTRAPMARYCGEPKGSCTLPLPLHSGTICAPPRNTVGYNTHIELIQHANVGANALQPLARAHL